MALAALDASIAEARAAIATLKTTERGLRLRLAALATTVALPELRVSVAALEVEQVELEERLEPLKAGTGKKVGKREREEVDLEWTVWKGRAERRKKAFNELWRAVGEALPERMAGDQDLWVGRSQSTRA